MIGGRPAQELELRHCFRGHPRAVCHLLRRESLAEPAAALLREVYERAGVRDQRTEPLEKRTTARSNKAGTDAAAKGKLGRRSRWAS